jgi:K+/H+ antiporter YhaU regulatory subunit KhtT
MDAGQPAAGPSTEAMPEVRDVTVGPGLADRSLREAQLRERFGVIVVTLRRTDGEVIRHPSPDAVLRTGDAVRLFGLRQQIDALAKAMEREEA